MVSGYGDAGFRLEDRRPVEHVRRVPDRRTLLRAYLFGRLCALRNEMDGMHIGHEQDARRYALLEARENELRRLCEAVGIDPETCDWLPLR